MSKKTESKSLPRVVVHEEKQGKDSWDYLKKKRGVRIIDTTRVRAER